ncbi:MAG: hypothetical protein AAF649_01820 [Verrucomicrobiota bacterium]
MSPFQHACVFGVQGGEVRRLSGYLKTHRVPDQCSQAAEQFIQRIGQPELTELAESVHAGLRSAFGYKRKEMDYIAEEGLTVIKTPDFDVTLILEQDAEDPSRYGLSARVNEFRQPKVVSEDTFAEAFGAVTDTVAIEFPAVVDVEAKIDQIEEIPELAQFLRYQPDGSSLTLELPQAGMRVVMNAERMTFKLIGQRNLALLIKNVETTLATLFNSGMELE